MDGLSFVDACTEEHFRAMSLLHARWVEVFRTNYETHNGVHGLLLYRGDTPVSCLNYCKARTVNYNPGDICTFDNANYADWGEIASFYTLPEARGKSEGLQNAFVFVLRENEKARRFYSAHGFSWDGTHADIPFPHGVICVDLRYIKRL